MVMRWIRAAVIALVVGLAALPAWARSPVGIWKLDGEAARAQLTEQVELMLLQLPEDQREQARAMMGPDAVDQMLGSLAEARVEFLPDGKLVARDPDGTEDVSAWSEENGMIRLDEPEGPDMIGTWEGDTLVFRFDLDAEAAADPDNAFAKELRFTLLPQ